MTPKIQQIPPTNLVLFPFFKDLFPLDSSLGGTYVGVHTHIPVGPVAKFLLPPWGYNSTVDVHYRNQSFHNIYIMFI